LGENVPYGNSNPFPLSVLLKKRNPTAVNVSEDCSNPTKRNGFQESINTLAMNVPS
jgi:hypothetical protein